MFSTKSIVEGSFLISIAVLMYILGIYNIAFGFIATLLCPVPIILLILRHDYKIIFSGFIVGIFLILSLAGALEALTFILELLIPGFVMGLLIKKDKSPGKTILITSITSVIVSMIYIFMASKLIQKDVIAELFKEMDVSVKAFTDVYSLSANKNAVTIKQQMDYMIALFKRIYPSIFISAIVLSISMNYEITRRIIIRLGHKIKEFDLINARIPEYFIWAFIFVFASKFFFVYTDLEKIISNYNINAAFLKYIEIIIDNIACMLFFTYFIQGLSISVIFMKKWQFAKIFIVINMILFFLTVLFFVPLLLGIFDFWFNFRDKASKIKQNIN